MASHAAKRIFNTLERATTLDQTRQIDLAYRMNQKALYAAVAQDRQESGVLYGFEVAVDSGANEIQVTEGLALLFNIGLSYPDDLYQWIESNATLTLSIPAATGYDRWDVVELAPGKVTTITTVVDSWQASLPPSGGFVPVTRDKEEQSAPVITMRVGADNAPNPRTFLPGISDVIPLAYVQVGSGGFVPNGFDAVVKCRPLLWPVGSMDTGDHYLPSTPGILRDGVSWVQGGGIEVQGAAYPVVSAGSVEVVAAIGRFENARQSFSTGVGTSLPISIETWSGGTAPVVDGPAYVYAFQIPYPTGYDAMADREFVPGSLVRGQFSSADNTGQFNCGLIVTPISPVPGVVGKLRTAQGGASADLEPNDWPFRTGTTRPTVVGQEAIYMGAFDYNSTLTAAMKQDYLGGGNVNLTGRYVANDFTGGADSTPLGFDIREFSSSGDDTTKGFAPLSATRFFCLVRFATSTTGTPAFNRLEFRDEAVASLQTPLASLADAKEMLWAHPTGIGTFSTAEMITLDVRSTFVGQNCTAAYFRPLAQTNTFVLYVIGYVDSHLASR